ncbi:SRPBCC family protein [Rhodococcus pyridinivorans]|uniref:SRPBCC family protein n=1 Tax=Rhodococcus pyridinivorans TaxID=103816 RepID=UPI003AF2C283
MPRPYASGVIDVPVDQVWNRLKDFGNISAIATAIEHSELVGEAGVGAVRRLTLGGGATLEERLVPHHATFALSTISRSC